MLCSLQQHPARTRRFPQLPPHASPFRVVPGIQGELPSVSPCCVASRRDVVTRDTSPGLVLCSYAPCVNLVRKTLGSLNLDLACDFCFDKFAGVLLVKRSSNVHFGYISGTFPPSCRRCNLREGTIWLIFFLALVWLDSKMLDVLKKLKPFWGPAALRVAFPS